MWLCIGLNKLKALFENAIHAIPENEPAMPTPSFKDCVLVKSFSSIYMHMHVHIHEKFFSKALSPNMALASQHRFLDWRLTHFEKELLKCCVFF